MRNKVVLTTSSLKDKGGVASFYNGVLPYLSQEEIFTLEIGGTKGVGGVLHPLVDQLRFRQTVNRWKPELIHLNPSLNFKSFIRDGVFAWQAKKRGYPLLVFWHGWEKDFEMVVKSKYLPFFNRTFGKADGFIVLASEFEKVLREWGVTAPIYQQTTCVDDKLLNNADINSKWSSASEVSAFKILFLARLARSKGVFETIQAAKLLLNEKLPVRFTIAGDGEMKKEIEEFTRSEGLDENQVKFTGDIRGKEKIKAFAEHHIYCFPTYYGEGLPTSVVEAMSFSMPVITCPVGGLKDFFIDGDMGYLVEQKNPETVANSIKKLILRPSRMADIGRNNARYADTHFKASVVANKLSNIYREILSGRQGALIT